jgi:hypothetical protein
MRPMGRDILAVWGGKGCVGVRICIDTGAVRPREVIRQIWLARCLPGLLRKGFQFKAKVTGCKADKVGELID